MSEPLHVTGICKLLGMVTYGAGNEIAMHRGTAVHMACQYDDEGDLREDELDPAIMPYLKCYRDWRNLVKPTILGNEHKLINEPLRVQGTLDRLVEIDGKRYVVDLKTGSPAPWHRWQLAMYRLLWALQEKQTTPLGAALYLQTDGPAQWVPYEDRYDPERGRALIITAHILSEMNVAGGNDEPNQHP